MKDVRIYHVAPDGERVLWDGWCECQLCRENVAEDGTVGRQWSNSFPHPAVAWDWIRTHTGQPLALQCELRAHYEVR